MSRTALKKSILFALTVILLVVYIFQVSLNGREKKTTLSVKKDVDCVEIENVRGGIRLDKVDGVWKVSTVKNPDLKFETEEYAVKNIVDSISLLNLLGTVSSGEANKVQRYGLDDESKISVKAYSKNKVVRTLFVGKNSVSGSQSYVQVDGKKSVMVSDSALHTVFDRSLPSLRKKVLYEIASDSISSVTVKKGETEYEIILDQVEAIDSEMYSVSSQRTEWKLLKAPEGKGELELDQGKVGAWIVNLSKMNVSQWCESDVALPEKSPDISMDIAVGGMIYSMNFYSLEENDRYLCSTNQTKGLFYMSKTVVDDFAKELDDLLAKVETQNEEKKD